MTIEILPDGTVKTTTDPISPANHQSAEAFMKDLQTLTGGLVSRKARGKHAHVHHQEHADHSH
jgi:hypothetical protein